MHGLEQLLGLFIASLILAGTARRLGAPYPVFLALGGAVLAFLPGAPTFTVPPELALAIFVAPILLDAAYDASLRDLKDNWAPVTGLVVFAVALTTLAVALVVRWFVPDMAWGPAIALGAVVAPPDAVAATSVLRLLKPPHRILTILEGESLFNDATSLLIFRLAVGAVAANAFSVVDVAPAFLLAVAGSIVVGPALGWVTLQLLDRVEHVPTAIILQFVTTFGVWLFAEQVGLSGVLTMVSYAITVARTLPEHTPARLRISTYAVWETAVFALTILAFIFIGLQIRPILNSLEAVDRGRYFAVAGAVLATVIVVRVAWHMSFNAVTQWWHRRVGFQPPRPMLRPSLASGLVISWSGMRGIVTLAAALALPARFPHRDLIVFTAFIVVLGTLVIQGMTLGPLLHWLRVRDDDLVGGELRAARDRALAASLATFADDPSPIARAVRQEFTAQLTHERAAGSPGNTLRVARNEIHANALEAARRAVHDMRAQRGDWRRPRFTGLKRNSTGSRCPVSRRDEGGAK